MVTNPLKTVTVELTIKQLASLIDRQPGAYNQLPQRDRTEVAGLYHRTDYYDGWDRLIDAYQDAR